MHSTTENPLQALLMAFYSEEIIFIEEFELFTTNVEL